MDDEIEEEFEDLLGKWRRDYTLNKIPRNENGNPLFVEDTEENYEKYLNWLADYLFSAKIEAVDLIQITESNLASVQTLGHKMLILGFDACVYDYEISFCDYEAETPESADLDSLDSYYLNYFQKAKLEDKQKNLMNLSSNIGVKYADIAWRTPIAVLLKKENDKSERINLLRTFFEEYDYQSYK